MEHAFESKFQQRCKDCEHWKDHTALIGWCRVLGAATDYAPNQKEMDSISVKWDFGCIYFEGRRGPFIVESHGGSYAVSYSRLRTSPVIMANLDVAKTWCEWLNKLWNERE